jgi:hypothetical protein
MQAATTGMNDADIQRAEALWAEYQSRHDVSHLIGQAAGIEPTSGHIWIGETGVEVVRQRDAEGINAPLYFVRVGYPTYYRKGGRR